jgi:hypothetical protein
VAFLTPARGRDEIATDELLTGVGKKLCRPSRIPSLILAAIKICAANVLAIYFAALIEWFGISAEASAALRQQQSEMSN